MTVTITAVAKNLVNLVYPLRCAACSISLDPLNELGVCKSCADGIKPNPKSHCTTYGDNFEIAYSAFLYEKALKELIHVLKYKNRMSLSGFLSEKMISFVKENEAILMGIDVISFVPIDIRRLRQRSFNQSKIFAFNLSKSFGVPLVDMLEKSRRTRPQNELSREERLVNLTGAFKIKKGETAAEGLRVLLVDDVMTTGSTLEECSKTLLSAGAASIRCLTLARGV